jgi:hypothetical protein
MEEETWLTPEPLMISKRSAPAWKNCAVSARGRSLPERTVGRFSRRVETIVIYCPLAFIKGIGRSQRNCFQIQSLVFRKASWTGSGNELGGAALGLINLPTDIPDALHSSTPRTGAKLGDDLQPRIAGALLQRNGEGLQRGACSLLRHPGLAQAGENRGFVQSADGCGVHHTREIPVGF